jgi:hypothetical protein
MGSAMNTTPEYNDPVDEGADNWMASFITSDTEMASTFRLSLLGIAYKAYQQEFGHLPGSFRTSRLRKKRCTRVTNWYFDEYLGRPGNHPEQANQSEPAWVPEGEFSIDNILKLVASLPVPDGE